MFYLIYIENIYTVNIHDNNIEMKLNSNFKINNSTYDTNISILIKKLETSLDIQYIQDSGNLDLKILEYRPKFEIIKVQIPDKKLQMIWDLLFSTEMMQNFILEDILHHYFIKRIPETDLTGLFTFTVEGQKITLSVNDFPKIETKNNEQFISMGMSADFDKQIDVKESPLKNIFLEAVDIVRANNQNLISNNLKIQQDSENMKQDMQILISGKLLSDLGQKIMKTKHINLSKIDALKSLLVLKNLKVLFPKLSEYYDSDSTIINIDLDLTVESSL